MTPRELACLQAVDAAILALQSLRLSLISALSEPSPTELEAEESEESDSPEGGCYHTNLQIIATMGKAVSMCPDCGYQSVVQE